MASSVNLLCSSVRAWETRRLISQFKSLFRPVNRKEGWTKEGKKENKKEGRTERRKEGGRKRKGQERKGKVFFSPALA